MKPKTRLKIALPLASLLGSPLTNAATIYWDGASASWNTASNWTTAAGATTPDPGAAPGSSDDTIFNRTAQNGNINIALDADQASQSLTFNSTGSTTIRGNTSGTTARILSLGSGGIIKNGGSGTASFGGNVGVVNITLSADQTWTNDSGSALNIGTGYVSSATDANVALGAFNLIVDGTGNTSIGVSNQAEAVLTGTGSLTKNGTGFLQLGGNNSAGFSGKVTINGGVLNYGDVPTALGTGNLEINGGILEARWSTGKTWTQGTGAGQIQITGGVSGFGQSNNATFNIGNVTWGSATFAPTEFVLHGATAGSAQLINFSSAINLNGADRTIRSDQAGGLGGTGSGTFSGNITNGTGTAGLIKVGIGRHVLTGINTYNGGTTISQGTLQFGNITAMPSSGAVAVSSGAAIGIDLGGAGDWTTGTSGVGTLGGLLAGVGGAGTSTVTYSGDAGLRLNVAANSAYSATIANPSGSTSLQLIKDGTSSLTLSGNNSYSGGTTLVNGALIVASNTAIPSTGTIRLNGGTIQSNDATARTFSNPVLIGGNFTVGGTGDLTFSDTGASALGATRQITVNTGINATFAQAFSGSGAGITKAGAGTLVLTGNNTYTGATSIDAGTLVLNNDGDVTGSAVTFGGSNTGLTITGGSGVTSTWNAGGGNFGTGNNLYNNVQVQIDGAGFAGSAVVTNVGTLVWGRTATNSTLLLTDGGQMNVNGEVRIGNPYYIGGAPPASGNTNLTIQGGTANSTFTGNGASTAFYIGYGERTGSKDNIVTVSDGGILTNIGHMVIGHIRDAQNGDYVSTGNKLVVTGTGTASVASLSLGYVEIANAAARRANANTVEVTGGGALSSSGAAYIGRANIASSTSNANTATVTGTGSSWNAGNQIVYVGHTNNATAQSNDNILTVSSGGVLSNVSSLIVGFGTGTETGNQVVINGGSITATSVTVASGNSIEIGANGGTLGGNITNNGTLTIGSTVAVALAGNISGSGTITQTGSGTTTLSGSNTYTGATTVNGGVIRLDSATALPGGIGNTGGTSALTLNGGVIGLGNGNFQRGTGTGVTQVQWTGSGGFAAYGADRTANLGGAGASVTWAAGNFVPNASNLILGAADATHTVDFQNPIDLGAATRTVQVDNGPATVEAILSGDVSNGSLTKAGAGTLQLTAANTYTGATTVTAGTLQLAGAAGAITSTSGVDVGGGTITLSNTSALNNTDRLNDSGSVTLSGSGVLNFSHTGGAVNYSETTGALSVTGSGNQIITSRADAGQTSTLTFASLSNSGSLQFYGAGLGADARNRVFITGQSAGAISGATHFDPLTGINNPAGYSLLNGVIIKLSDVDVDVLGGQIPDGSAAVSIIQAGTSGDITLGSSVTAIDSLNQTASQLGTITMSAKTLRTDLVLIGNTNAPLTIGTTPGEGTLTTNTPGGNLVLNNAFAAPLLLVNAVVADYGSGSSLIKTGAGTVQLTAGATYAGATGIGSGTLTLTGAGSIPDTSAVDLSDPSSVLHLSGISASAETIGALTGVSGSSIVIGDKNFAINGISPAPFAGVISGSGGALTLLPGATQTLSGDNTFTGDVTIGAGGSLSVNKIETSGAQPLGLGTSPIVMQGNIGSGSTLTYTGAGAGATNRGLSLNGGQGGTVNVAAGTLTVNGTLSGSANFLKAGAGTMVLAGGASWNADGFVNDGTLVLGGDASPGSNTLSGGNWTVATGATMRLNTTGALETSTLTRNGTFNLEAGTLRTNTIAGAGAFVWGAGTIAPLSNLTEGSTDRTDPGGSPSGPVVREGTILDFSGNLTSSNGSILDLGGLFTDNGLRYNQINISGALSLAAADELKININPYLLRPNTYTSTITGDWGTLRLAMADSISGTFDTVTGIGTDFIGFAADPGSGGTDSFINPASLAMNTYYIEYRTSGVLSGAAVLFHYKVAGSVPEPGSAGLLLGGVILLRAMRRVAGRASFVRAPGEERSSGHRRRRSRRTALHY
jgi:fibronectin-binding autotransporter adhesin